jgi:hypothetical protein
MMIRNSMLLAHNEEGVNSLFFFRGNKSIGNVSY